MSLGNRNKNVKTFDLLNRIVTILGGTKMSFWPFINLLGSEIFPYGAGNDGIVATSSDENGAVTINTEFNPVLTGVLNGLYFDSSANNHLLVLDNDAYSFTDGADDDAAFSVGMWIMPTEALGTARTLMAKFGATANAEEWRLQFDASGNLLFELHDASASQKELATGASDVLVPWIWQFVIATYDGAEATPDVHLYKNASDTNASGATVEDGGAGYTGMENTACDLLIGCDDATGTPANEFEGYMAMPFVTGKELSAANVTALYGVGKTLLGL